MRILLPAALLAAFLLSSCTSRVEVQLDNPTETPLTVILNEEEYVLDPMTVQTVEAVKGENTLAASRDGEPVFDGTVEVTGEGLLNPIGAIYVQWNDLYLQDLSEAERYMDNLDVSDEVEVNGMIYEDVDFDLYDATFIEKTWDYGLDEGWPDEVSVSGGFAIKGKLYRIPDLEDAFYMDWEDDDYDQYLEEMMEDEGFQQYLDSLEATGLELE